VCCEEPGIRWKSHLERTTHCAVLMESRSGICLLLLKGSSVGSAGSGGELRGCLAAGCWARKLMGNATLRFADYRNFCLCLFDFGDKSHDRRSTVWAHSISAAWNEAAAACREAFIEDLLASDPLVGTGHGILELQRNHRKLPTISSPP
jgi:hypothetical protein